MKFNAKKCYILRIRNKFNYLFYSLDNCILKNVPSNPYLGLEISHDLKWHSHVNNITSKASRTLGFLQRNLQHCTKDCRRTAYLSLVRSTLEYGSIIWDSHYKCDIDKLERIQNRAARFIKKDYHSKDPGCMTNMLVLAQDDLVLFHFLIFFPTYIHWLYIYKEFSIEKKRWYHLYSYHSKKT